MVKRILLSIVMLMLIAYLVVAISAFNRKPADQTCRDMELVIKDMPMRKGMIRVMEISREMVQAGRIPITRIRIWHCIYRRMESRSGEF